MPSTPTRTSTRRTGTGGRTARRPLVRRATAALALVVAVGGAALVGPPPDPAAAQAPPVTGAACAPGQGVTVVVDFNGLPGGIRVGCAPGAQASGLSALGAAGFGVGMGDAPGVVCTIDGAPTEGYPFCWLTGGYWSYWRAPRGGSWAFSPVGAGGGPLPVDSVEGWSWAPGFASQAPRANETSAPPPTTTSTSTTSSTTTIPTTSTSTTSTPLGSTSTSPPPATSAPATTSPTTAPGATTAQSAVAGAGAGSGAGPVRRETAGGSLARTGSDTRAPVTLALALLLLGTVLVVTSRRLAATHR